MPDDANIQWILMAWSLTVLCGLMVFQYLHYVVAAWRFWADDRHRIRKVALVGIGWLAFGAFTVGVVPHRWEYVPGLPFTLAALFGPSIVALLLLGTSQRFRDFADSLSLRWMIQSFAGPARMLVGVTFLFWFFSGRLTGVVAWIAGPGDWIAGFITYTAVRRLQPIADAAGITKQHWSARDVLAGLPSPGEERVKAEIMRSGLRIATLLVAFGIADFVAAPASTTVAIALDNVPHEMGSIPLAMIPNFLVPMVLLMEVLAMRQFYVLSRTLPST